MHNGCNRCQKRGRLVLLDVVPPVRLINLSQLFGGIMIFPGQVKVEARSCDFQSKKIQHSLWQDFGLAAVRQVLEAISFMTSPSRILMALLWCVCYFAIL